MDFFNVMNWDEFYLPYEKAVNELCLKFSDLKNEFKKIGKHSPIDTVKGRLKSVGSILTKAEKKNIPYHKIAEKLEDIAGIRIICQFENDIQKVISLIRNRNGIDLEIIRETDYITNKKESGYRSYHIIIRYSVMMSTGLKKIPAEIQIRTLAMDFWASIEHSINYKYNGNIPDEIKLRLKSSAEASYQLDLEMGTIRGEIIEANKIIQQKNDLVEKVLVNMHKLYKIANLESANELNREFITIYEECDLEKLQAFRDKQETLIKMYKLEG